MTKLLLASVVAATLFNQCRSSRRDQMEPLVPRIVSVAPDSVAVLRGPLAEVVIRGQGFEAGDTPGNVVQIGPVVLRGVRGNDTGTEIRIVVPAEYPSGGEAPPLRMQPGRYDVTVRTRAGVSNAMSVKVVE